MHYEDINGRLRYPQPKWLQTVRNCLLPAGLCAHVPLTRHPLMTKYDRAHLQKCCKRVTRGNQLALCSVQWWEHIQPSCKWWLVVHVTDMRSNITTQTQVSWCDVPQVTTLTCLCCLGRKCWIVLYTFKTLFNLFCFHSCYRKVMWCSNIIML